MPCAPLTREEAERLYALASAVKAGETVKVGGVTTRVAGLRVRLSRSGALVISAETETG